MKDSTIIDIGKYTFLIFLILGNVCLFGYIISKIGAFAAGGLYLILIGSVVNLIIITGLLIYGSYYKPHLIPCLKAIGLICFNIPISILYFFIGLSLLNF